jgi:hypothetical protein
MERKPVCVGYINVPMTDKDGRVMIKMDDVLLELSKGVIPVDNVTRVDFKRKERIN